MRTRHTTTAELPMREVRRRLSWVEFLAPLSEEELVVLLRDASFVHLKEGDEMVVGPQEHAERMLVVVAGQLQVFEVSLSSEREFTLCVGGDGLGAPLDARAAPEGDRALAGVRGEARRPGSCRAGQPRGGDPPSAHAGQPAAA